MEPVSISQGRLRQPILRLQSDERLGRLASAGDDGAFEVLVRRHRPTLQRACARVLSGARAEDATQQALLNAHQALRRNGPPELFEPWLYRIAFNAALKELRAVPDELSLDPDGVDDLEGPPERVERREGLREMVGAIGALPERQRRALVLREMEGRSHDEIARDLGLSRGAVRQLIHRARTSVRSAVTAITPYGLLLRIASDSDGSTRMAEIVAGGGAGAYVAKTLVAAMVAGGIAGGVALAPREGSSAGAAGVGTRAQSSAGSGRPPLSTGPGSISVPDQRGGKGGHERTEKDDDGRGHGSDDEDRVRSRSGSDSGGDDSGSGSPGEREGDDSDSSDSSGRGGSGGSGSSGSSSGGGSGSSGSGSGSSGSGSGSSGSGSGSGSSSSGSGSEEDARREG